MGSRMSVAGFEFGTLGLTGLQINHYPIEEDYIMQ